ncbi:polyubiquitin-like [Ananas comosus]|uniref:AN1-type zinc finger protein 4 n=1 Tax=Ananas comosus TaxID=4615 RepID=A0A199UFP5_ANACO|nr:polyubiquitin-like [Ananas comosus]OAY63536.1 AN1-type zinc finger protein 4 [Ananas comosus]
MDVNFVTSAGETFTIEIGYFDTVLEIKEKVEKYKGYPVTSQKLIFNGHYLLNDRDTEHYEILQGSTVQLVITNPGLGPQRTPPPASSSPATRARRKLNLPVESMNGSLVIHVEMEEHSKVGLLRDELRRAYAMINLNVPDKYFFVHNKEVMNEDYSFHQHNVKDGDVIKVFEGKATHGDP